MAHCFRFSLLVSLSTRAGRKYHPVLEQGERSHQFTAEKYGPHPNTRRMPPPSILITGLKLPNSGLDRFDLPRLCCSLLFVLYLFCSRPVIFLP